MKNNVFLRLLVVLHFLTLVSLPLYIIRFSLFTIPVTLLEILLILSVGLTFIYCFKNKVSIKLFKTFFDTPLVFLLIAALLSLFVTPDLRGGLGVFKAYFVEPILFFYSLVIVGRLHKSFDFVLHGLLGSALLVGLLGFTQALTGQFIFAQHEWVQGRVSAFYNSANSLALFIGPIIPLIAVFFFRAKNYSKKILLLIMLLFFSFVMYWTKSKGGMLSEIFSLGVVVYGLLSHKYQQFKKLWILVPILFVLFSAAFYVQVYNMYNPSIQTPGAKIEDDTLQIRYATWLSTSRILNGEVILGTGLNGFKYEYDQYKLPDFQEDFQYPHNTVFNFWTETGLLGLVSFLLLIVYSFISLMQNHKGKIDYLSLGLIASFSYIVVHGLVDVPYFKNDLSVQFWSLIAITQLVRDRIKEHI